MARELSVKVGRKTLSVKETMLDRAIGYVSPTHYARRMQARFTTQALSGGYFTPKKRGQLGEWKPSAGDAESDLLPDLPALREASRDLSRTSPLATGALKTKVTQVVGSGLKLHASVDRNVLSRLSDERADEIESGFEREWDLWADSTECDIARVSTFDEITRMVFQSRLESGDVAVLMPFIERPTSPFGLKLQVIEGDRICNPNFQADSEKLAGGIEKNPKTGEFIAAHVADQHPGSRHRAKTTWTRVPFRSPSGARQLLLIMDRRRPGQPRGVPDLAPVIETLKQLSRYTEAEIASAVISSFFTVFIEAEGPQTLAPMQPIADVGGSGSDKDYKLGKGAILDLSPGEKVQFADPSRPNRAFDPFILAVLRQVGVALELPFEILIKHFTASYSASRAAMVEAWKYFMVERSQLITQFCRPVYETLISESILRGRVAAPGFRGGSDLLRKAYLGSGWVGPGRGQINEEVEVNAAVERINNNLSTLADETAQISGGDWQRNLRQRRREVTASEGLLPTPNTQPVDENTE